MGLIEDSVNYPCLFEEIVTRPLEDVPQLEKRSWRKVRALGEGPFGKVYSAQNLAVTSDIGCTFPLSSSEDGHAVRTPKNFAVKAMRREKVLSSPGGGLECPRNELCAAMALQSYRLPYVAEVYGVAQDRDYFYLATEYCSRGELLQVVNGAGPTQADELLRKITQQILSAVSALHNVGIAHRDISLENVLVTEDGSLRLIDFGQAIKVHPEGKSALEMAVPPCKQGYPGKKFYRAPEVYFGKPYMAKKLDIFAVGVLLYVMVTGDYPFTSGNEYREMFPTSEANASYCKPLARRLESMLGDSKVSPVLVDFMQQLLAPNPQKRMSADEALQHPWFTGMLDDLWQLPELVIDDADEEEEEDASTTASGGTSEEMEDFDRSVELL